MSGPSLEGCGYRNDPGETLTASDARPCAKRKLGKSNPEVSAPGCLGLSLRSGCRQAAGDLIDSRGIRNAALHFSIPPRLAGHSRTKSSWRSGVDASGVEFSFQAVPITDAAQVKSVVEKFRGK